MKNIESKLLNNTAKFTIQLFTILTTEEGLPGKMWGHVILPTRQCIRGSIWGMTLPGGGGGWFFTGVL